jgi:acetyl esterase
MSEDVPNVAPLRARLRRRATRRVSEGLFQGLARAGRLHPLSRPSLHGAEVVHDLAYLPGGNRFHRLDLYRPTHRPGPFPVVLYIHGGGFALLTKDTHWIMGLAYARRGYVVANISYRLAPEHPFPAAIADACAALVWVRDRIADFGGDPERLVFAGESAGANLVTALAIATCYRRPEDFAAQAWETGLVPAAVIPAAGILQVTDPARFSRRRRLPGYVKDVIGDVSDAYLRNADARTPGALDLADPLVFLERGRPPDRPLPPFFIPVGTRDPLLDDTRRLAAALRRLGVLADARYYSGEIHAFHALLWRPAARRCWTDTFAFLDRALWQSQLPRGLARGTEPPEDP